MIIIFLNNVLTNQPPNEYNEMNQQHDKYNHHTNQPPNEFNEMNQQHDKYNHHTNQQQPINF